MNVTFWHSDKPRERLLADAFLRGCDVHGDIVERRPLTPEVYVAPGCDVAVMVGVKSKALFQAHWDAGVHTVYLDKGYTRHAVGGPVKTWEYWRVAVDAHHPTRRLLERPLDPSRRQRLGLELKPWRTQGDQVVIAGSSAKYHDFYGLWEPTRYTTKLIRQLRFHTQREIVYRPKPSWRDAVPIEGARFSQPPETIDHVLRNAWCVVTHGSNACVEAMLAGIPCIVTGDAVTRALSGDDIATIEAPKLAPQAQREQWLDNLAWWQWTQPEFATGEAWAFIRPWIYG